MALEYKKKAACVRCKTRKIKCDYDLDSAKCKNCAKNNYRCVISKDNRKLRISNNEINGLRLKILELENYIDFIKSGGKENIIPVTSHTIVGEDEPKDTVNSVNVPKEFKKVHVKKDNREFGPTSIFLDDSENQQNAMIDHNSIINILNKDKIILNAIKNFFQWLYPDLNFFIPRETFLIDFFHPKNNNDNPYCNKELVYSMCSIGVLLIDENDLKEVNKFQLSKEFYEKSKNSLLNKGINRPNICNLQSFILLGMYNLYYLNNVETCWIFIGISIRIGFSIKFNEDLISNRNKSILRVFKSRIYWGVFIIEHFVRLVTGRFNRIIEVGDNFSECERVPDLEWIKEFNFKKGNDIIDVVNPMNSLIRLIIINDKFIKFIHNEDRLREFNRNVLEWRSQLTEKLCWDNDLILQDKCFKSPEMIHIYYYYILILSMNIHNGDISMLKEGIKVTSCCVYEFIKKYGIVKISPLQNVACIYAVKGLQSIIDRKRNEGDYEIFKEEWFQQSIRKIEFILRSCHEILRVAQEWYKVILDISQKMEVDVERVECDEPNSKNDNNSFVENKEEIATGYMGPHNVDLNFQFENIDFNEVFGFDIGGLGRNEDGGIDFDIFETGSSGSADGSTGDPSGTTMWFN